MLYTNLVFITNIIRAHLFCFELLEMKHVFKNYITKLLLCLYLGVPPKDSSILINALLIQHYKRGAYYPKGGASEIAFHIIRTINKYGGQCLVRAPVSQILVNGKGEAYGKPCSVIFHPLKARCSQVEAQ